MADYLPPVVARLSMDLGDFAAKIAEAKSLMKGLAGDFKIGTDGLDQAAAKVTALKTALNGLSGTVKVNTDGLGSMAAKTVAAGAATAAATGLMINGWRLTATALHWVIAGGAELLAVTLPALVALGAGLAVMYPAAQQVTQHMQALSTATQASGQMFGQTIGDVLGMGHALQTAQEAAQPQVYGILGSALTAVQGHMGGLVAAGSQVSQMFATFAAKVAVDFGPGGALGGKTSSLFRNMTTDLQGLGQVLGNVGHTFVNFASSMPGLAEFLLKAAVGVTGLVSHLSGLAPILITAAMGFEEFNRWGGLLATTLGKMGLSFVNLQGGIFSLTRFASVVRGLLSVVPTLGLAVAKLFSTLGATGAAAGLTEMATGLQGVISKIGPFQAALVVAAAVGLGILIDKVVTARDAIQQLTDSLQQATLKASNLQAFQVAAQNIGQLNTQLAHTPAVVLATTVATSRFAAVSNVAGTITSELSAGLKQQEQDFTNVAQGAALLAATYHISVSAALALATAAGVTLAKGITGAGQAAQIARQQVAGLVQGFAAMGAPMSAVGSDVLALAVQSGLAATKVSQLNSAWDQFISGLTGGTGAMSSFVLDLANVANAAGNANTKLSQIASSPALSQFSQQLKASTIAGAQAWQNFNQLITSGNSLIDWMRTAGAEGALSGKQFTQGVLDMASALVPLASASKTAQADVLALVAAADPSINTWAKLGAAIKTSGASLSGLGGLIGTATSKMANMSQVAQNLGTATQSALTGILASAKVMASGVGSAMQAYEQALMNGSSSASSLRAEVMMDFAKMGVSAQQAEQIINAAIAGITPSKTVTIDIFTNYITSGGGASAGINPGALPLPGHAAGTPSAAPGWAWVGEAGPELVKFRGGETVLPNSVSMGYAGGAGDVPDQHIHVYLDGRQVYQAVAEQSAATQRRTGHNMMTRRTR